MQPVNSVLPTWVMLEQQGMGEKRAGLFRSLKVVKGFIFVEIFLLFFSCLLLGAQLSPFVWIRDDNFAGTTWQLSGYCVMIGIKELQNIPEAGKELTKVT